MGCLASKGGGGATSSEGAAAGATMGAVPRSHGILQVQGGSIKWTNYCCVSKGGVLLLRPAEGCTHDEREDPGHTVEPELSLPLIGTTLRAHGKTGFTLQNRDSTKYNMRCPGGERERSEWMLGFSHQPGMYRKVEDYYDVLRLVGQGSNSMVYECRSRFTGEVYGLKRRVHKDVACSQQMHNELAHLQAFSKDPHPAVYAARPCQQISFTLPRLQEFFFDSDGHIALVVELMTGGELFERILAEDGFTEGDARRIVQKIALGIAYLHGKGVAHRDLKPENLMFSHGGADAEIKIMDYDLAKTEHAPRWTATTPCGTSGYMAPEIIDVGTRYGQEVDLWSLGCIIYIMLSGKLPFDTTDELRCEELVKKGEFTFPDDRWGRVSPEAKDLVKKLLVVDAAGRLTAEEVLEHPWVAGEEEEGADLPRDDLKESLRQLSSAMMGSLKDMRTASDKFAHAVSKAPKLLSVPSKKHSLVSAMSIPPKLSEQDSWREGQDSYQEDMTESAIAAANGRGFIGLFRRSMGVVRAVEDGVVADAAGVHPIALGDIHVEGGGGVQGV